IRSVPLLGALVSLASLAFVAGATAGLAIPKGLPIAPPRYSLTDLGIPTGFDLVGPVGLSNNGQVAATVFDFTRTVYYAFLYQNGQWTNIGSGQYGVSTASGINGYGQVVGDFGFWDNPNTA